MGKMLKDSLINLGVEEEVKDLIDKWQNENSCSL